MKQRGPSRVVRTAFAVLVAIGLAMLFTLTAMRYRDSALLVRTAQVAAGSIVEKQCHNHATVAYSFLVDGHSFAGTGMAGVCGKANCDDAAIGDAVQLIYSSQKPQISACMTAGAGREAAIANEKRRMDTAFLAPLLLGLMILLMKFRASTPAPSKARPRASAAASQSRDRPAR